MPRPRLSLLLAAAIVAAAGCALPGSRSETASYDFGPLPAAGAGQRLRQPLLLYDVSSPAWMDSPSMHYRLAYQDAARPHPYAASRWVMAPAALLTGRLRQQLAARNQSGILVPADGVRSKYALRIELDEFIQVFDAPDKSRGVVRLRASILGSRDLVAQRVFSLEQAARTPDADGGARALITATDRAIEQIIGWTAEHAK